VTIPVCNCLHNELEFLEVYTMENLVIANLRNCALGVKLGASII
jgi:hypothetical protein